MGIVGTDRWNPCGIMSSSDPQKGLKLACELSYEQFSMAQNSTMDSCSVLLLSLLMSYWRLSGNKGIQKNMPHGKFQVLDDVVDMFMMQNYHNDTDN